MTAEQIDSFFALAFGFGVAGILASFYQLVTSEPASFRLLQRGGRLAAFAAVPLLVFAAPFIIMRNTLRGSAIESRPFLLVMAATVIAGGWSLMSGTVVMMALAAIGAPAG
jgi:hypothetical protein